MNKSNLKTPEPRSAIAALVTHLESEGPNMRKVARLLGVNEATLRYWFREKLATKGFVLQAAVNYGAIGLQRIMVTARSWLRQMLRPRVSECMPPVRPLQVL